MRKSGPVMIGCLVGVMGLFFVSGCKTYVKEVEVSPCVSDRPAKLSGTPQETIDYFEKKYPPDSWKPANVRARVAVGPICLSREAVIQLTGNPPEEIRAQAQAGTARAVVTVRRGDRDVFFFVAKTSQEVQSIIIQNLVTDGGFRVYALPENETQIILDGTLSYQRMYNDGIRYYLDGTVVTTNDPNNPTKVYLRFADTATREIICATSGEGNTLRTAALNAALAMAKSVNIQRGTPSPGGK
jgi:hypothetical protein